MSETLNPDDIKVVKLVSGKTIIGFQIASSIEELHETPELDSYIVIQYPYEIECDPKIDEEKFSINLFRFMPYLLDDSFLIRKNNIEILGSPDDDMMNCYMMMLQAQLFGSNHDPDLDN